MDSSQNSPLPDGLAQHAGFIRALAQGLLGDAHLAEDVLQETWLKWLERPPRDKSKATAWLRKVAQGLAINRGRARSARRVREQAVARAELSADPCEELAQAELIQLMVEGVLALEQPLRSTVLYTFFRGWSAPRIAQELEIPASTVRARLKRALHELRERLDDRHAGGRQAWAVAMGSIASNHAIGTWHVGLSYALFSGTGAMKLALAGGLLLLGFWGLRNGDKTGFPVDQDHVARNSEVAEPGALAVEVLETSSTPQTNQRVSVADPGPAPGNLLIRGVVLNRAYEELGLEQAPASGLKLTLSSSRPALFELPAGLGEIDLDAQGAFRVEFPDPGVRPLSLRFHVPKSEQYRGLSLERTLKQGQTERTDLVLWRAAHGLLSGVVVDGAGDALPHVAMTFKASVGEPVQQRSFHTDKQGRFEFLQSWPARIVEVQDPGLTVFDVRNAVRRKSEDGEPLGGWTEMRVSLLPASSLHVRVVDGNGEGIPNTKVSVEVDEAERATLEVTYSYWGPPERSVQTDEAGWARLEDVWAERRLAVLVDQSQERPIAKLLRGDQLVFDEARGGTPIILERGRTKQLFVQWGSELVVQGTLLHAGGEPAQGAEVFLYDGGKALPFQNRLRALTTDGEGKYQVSLRRRTWNGPLLVVARWEQITDPGFTAHMEPRGPLATAASATRSHEEALGGVLRIDLKLERTHSIRGSLHGPDGELLEVGPQQARVWAVPAGADSQTETTSLGKIKSTLQGGRFEISGLPEGPYDLYCSPNLRTVHGFWRAITLLPGVASGTRDVHLKLKAGEEVRIKLRVHGERVSGMYVLHGRYIPKGPFSYPKSNAHVQQAYSGPGSWPQDALLGFQGTHAISDAKGWLHYGSYRLEDASEHELSPMEPGWYRIGVDPIQSDGGPAFLPTTTELQYFPAGDYEIDLHPRPATSVWGRVAGGQPSAVMLLDATGRPVPLRAKIDDRMSYEGDGSLESLLLTNAQGRFQLIRVPLGEHLVRTGSREDLQAGRFHGEYKVNLQPGMNPLELGF